VTYINHITLSTGHNRRSPRSEVGDDTLALLHPWLTAALNSGDIVPLPVPSLAHFGVRAIKEVGLVVTIYGPNGPHTPGKPHRGEWMPLVTLGVAQRSREAGDLWAMLVANFGARAGLKAPATPWVAVALHPSASGYPEALDWLGDLERCIAWAWITRNPDLRTVG
jgi:hypothetical protein